MSVLPSTVERHGYEGQTFGGFRLVRALASGGMATVYLGEGPVHQGIRQVAAIKVIHPHLARDRDFVHMFLDETRIVASIDHPNVCRMLDAGKAEGTYFIAMEYVMGETWAEVVARLVSTPTAHKAFLPIVAQVLAQASEGLHAAHEACDEEGRPLGVVHRDVSPHNIMVGYDGTVRLLDFGVAMAADRIHSTHGGTVKGRLGYMAPEQMRGSVVDRRADVWSLGVVLWEGLLRRRLFVRENQAKTVMAVTFDPLPTLSGSRYPVPRALARVASRALQRDREARYATAGELARELARYAERASVPVSMPELSRWMHHLFADSVEKKRLFVRLSTDPSGLAPFGPERSGLESRPEHQRGRTSVSVSAVRPVTQGGGHRTTQLAVGAALVVAGLLVPQKARDFPTAKPSRPAQIAKPAPTVVSVASPGISSLASTPAPLSAPETRAAGRVVARAIVSSTPGAPPPSGRVPRLASRSEAGGLSVVTSGPATQVYLGSRKLGRTPLRLTLPPGEHVLRYRSVGMDTDGVRRVTVTRGAEARVVLPTE